jgi:3-dehydroquinate synthase
MIEKLMHEIMATTLRHVAKAARKRDDAVSRLAEMVSDEENAMLDIPSQVVSDVRLQSLNINYEYPVIFTRDAFNPSNRCLVEALTRKETGKRHRCAIFIDDGVLSAKPDLADRIAEYASLHATRLEIAGPVIPVLGGERCKNDPEIVSFLLGKLSALAIDRHSFVIAIGGGAVLDAVGYAAAIFHRGVRHIRFPTTVLSQDDSGVGVKNAVNSLGLKNLIGTFAPPWAIINDSAFIDCLPDREKRAGMAEAVKVALIRDGNFFNWIESHTAELARFSPPHLDRLIKDCAELHMRQIRLGGDPFESGSARPLDFGHWSAHKLEHLSAHEVNHGEAVAIGVALDTRYSVMTGLLAAGEDRRVLRVLKSLGFSLWHDALTARNAAGELALLRGLADFQEHLGGELTVTLLEDIGRGIEVHEMDLEMVSGCIEWLQQEARAA